MTLDERTQGKEPLERLSRNIETPELDVINNGYAPLIPKRKNYKRAVLIGIGITALTALAYGGYVCYQLKHITDNASFYLGS